VGGFSRDQFRLDSPEGADAGAAGGQGGQGPIPGGPTAADGKKVLERLRKKPVVRTSMCPTNSRSEPSYKRIEEELRSQYSLGYTSEAKGSEYRKIRLSVKNKGLTVQSRDGYYPAP